LLLEDLHLEVCRGFYALSCENKARQQERKNEREREGEREKESERERERERERELSGYGVNDGCCTSLLLVVSLVFLLFLLCALLCFGERED